MKIADVQQIADELLISLDENQVDAYNGLAGLVLAAGRLAAPRPMALTAEQVFVQDISTWITAYFGEGGMH